MIKREWQADVLNVIILVIAGVIDATGYALLLLPSHVIDGGIAGVSLLMSHVTRVNAGVFLVCVNLPFFIIGFRKMGWRFILNSAIVIGVYAVMTYVYTGVLELSEVVYDKVGRDMLLCAIFGGLCSGMGSGISIKCGGAIDGIDVMAMMFAKKIGITVGQFIMIFNVCMYIVASIVLHDLRVGMYSILCYTIGIQAIDFVVNGFDKCKAVNVITSRGDDIAKALSDHLGRGITIIDVEGYYSQEKKTMMYCVVNRFEVIGIKRIIKDIDPNAFVTVNEITDIMGSEVKRESFLTKRYRKRMEDATNKATIQNVEDDLLGTENSSLEVVSEDVVKNITASSPHSDDDHINI